MKSRVRSVMVLYTVVVHRVRPLIGVGSISVACQIGGGRRCAWEDTDACTSTPSPGARRDATLRPGCGRKHGASGKQSSEAPLHQALSVSRAGGSSVAETP
jgi:hypothetical protein